MSNTVRVPGLRGRLPVKPAGERFAIGYLSDYLREPLPAPAYPVDVTGGIGDQDWGMLGNGPDPTCTTYPNGVGDCTFAGRQHYKMAKAADYRETEQWETSNALVAEYLAYDDGQDNGAVIADLLLAWYKAGKILAFAPVDHTDPAAIDSAMQAFRGAYCGVDLTDDANDLFSQGQPWTIANGEQPDPSEGHCIVKVKADGREPRRVRDLGCPPGRRPANGRAPALRKPGWSSRPKMRPPRSTCPRCSPTLTRSVAPAATRHRSRHPRLSRCPCRRPRRNRLPCQ